MEPKLLAKGFPVISGGSLLISGFWDKRAQDCCRLLQIPNIFNQRIKTGYHVLAGEDRCMILDLFAGLVTVGKSFSEFSWPKSKSDLDSAGALDYRDSMV